MLRLGARTRAGITLALGVLLGLSLVLLPGILVPPTANSTSTNSNIRAPTPTSTISPGNQNNQPTNLAPATYITSDLAMLIGLVLLPSIALSIIVRHLTMKRAQSKLTMETQ